MRMPRRATRPFTVTMPEEINCSALRREFAAPMARNFCSLITFYELSQKFCFGNQLFVSARIFGKF
jgi:hypothetical protein